MRGEDIVVSITKKRQFIKQIPRRFLIFVSGFRFRVDSDSLTITDVTEDDGGQYTCIVNTTLDEDMASARLTVVGECQPKLNLI